MSRLLAIHSYPGANAIVARHWPYFLRQGADEIVGIGTTGGGCEWPEGAAKFNIGGNSYIDGPILPLRLVNTVEALMAFFLWDILMVIEYDTLIFARIPVENMTTGAAAHLAGHQIGRTCKFYHNPWVFSRAQAQKFVGFGRDAIGKDVCERGTTEASPDVFVGYISENYDFPIQHDLWTEFSRNSLDLPGDLERAREAYLSGVFVIHGVKLKSELDFICG